MRSDISSATVASRKLGRPGSLWAVGFALGGLLWLPSTGDARQVGDESLSPREKATREIAIAETAERQALQLRRHPDFTEASRRDGELEIQLQRAQRLLGVVKDSFQQAEHQQSATGFSDAGLLGKRSGGLFAAYEERRRGRFAGIE